MGECKLAMDQPGQLMSFRAPTASTLPSFEPDKVSACWLRITPVGGWDYPLAWTKSYDRSAGVAV